MSNSITQDIQYKQTVVEYSYRHGVTKAAIKFKMYRKTIYRWREKYDGTAKSLKDKSRRPHSHPEEQRNRIGSIVAKITKEGRIYEKFNKFV